ncbi:hypothetical protein [Paenarthrobacter sp. C1]|uniref:hypothetical protein n=1 Tax=Paenarthrobacter sp. C1 TaxID=3400220 RepID=UPI003BF4D0D1
MTESQSPERESARGKKYPEHAFVDYERIIIERSAEGAPAGADRQGKRSQEQSLTFAEWYSRNTTTNPIPLGPVTS